MYETKKISFLYLNIYAFTDFIDRPLKYLLFVCPEMRGICIERIRPLFKKVPRKSRFPLNLTYGHKDRQTFPIIEKLRY